LFKDAVVRLNAADERMIAAEDQSERGRWPARLRIRDVVAAPGIWELTWSFAGPDGRATFELFGSDPARGIRWRRIGGHEIFKDPS
jgi:hypothetical protein